MTAEEIREVYEVLYDGAHVMLIDNRGATAFAAYWDYDVVVWDKDIEAEIGAGNRKSDGSYCGFYIYGPHALEMEGEDAACFAENILSGSYMAENPDEESLRACIDEFVTAQFGADLQACYDCEIEWVCGEFETDSQKSVPVDGLGVLARVYLPCVSNQEPLMVHFNVGYWCEPHFLLGEFSQQGDAQGPFLMETLSTVNLADSTREEFGYTASEWLLYHAIATHWTSLHRADELLERVKDPDLKASIADAIADLVAGDD